jgi:hypothetical protein
MVRFLVSWFRRRSRARLLNRALATATALALLPAATASASVVEQGYLPLKDGTLLNYTLTLPQATGRFPVVLQYDPYAAGVTSDPTWNDSGYAMLGVNFRGTGCSQGVFQPTRADIWGSDGGQVVAWAASQPWSDGNIAMTGFSFTGTSQIATAAYAGPALKAIMPYNVFPDFYRDLVYPGGIYNSWISAWVGAGRQFAVGAAAVEQGVTEPTCDANMAQQAAPNEAQTADTAVHPYRDDYWAHDPATLTSRVHIPILGCVNWQDTTVHARAFNEFRDDFDPQTTWLVGGDGAHTDCPSGRARQVRFLDYYLKHVQNGWPSTPHLLLVHEAGSAPAPDQIEDVAGRWETSFPTWADVNRAITPVAVYLHSGGLLNLTPPDRTEAPDSYTNGDPTGNTPADFGGNSSWNRPTVPGGEVTYTTPRLGHDAEFLGSGSANLWISSTAPDADLQITLSEIRPDGQEEYVENGWLRLSHRKLEGAGSTVLRPLHTDLQSDVELLQPDVPVRARIELQPSDHVFRAGSAIRLSIDTPGGWFASLAGPTKVTVEHSSTMPSALVLGDLPGAKAYAPLPSCSALLNQPCRPTAGAVPAGTLSIPEARRSIG